MAAKKVKYYGGDGRLIAELDELIEELGKEDTPVGDDRESEIITLTDEDIVSEDDRKAEVIDLTDEDIVSEENYKESGVNWDDEPSTDDDQKHQNGSLRDYVYGSMANDGYAKKGLGGWLFLFFIGLMAISLVLVNKIEGCNYVLDRAGGLPSAQMYPGVLYLVRFVYFGSMLIIGFLVVSMFYYVRKKSKAPRIINAFLFTNIVFIIMEVIGSAILFSPAVVLRPTLYIVQNVAWIAFCVISILYFNVSKRVRNTFVG